MRHDCLGVQLYAVIPLGKSFLNNIFVFLKLFQIEIFKKLAGTFKTCCYYYGKKVANES